jgi:hypothetical protein
MTKRDQKDTGGGFEMMLQGLPDQKKKIKSIILILKNI